MELMGCVLYGYMWAKILATALVCAEGKYSAGYLDGLKKTASFYFEKILPRYKSLAEEVAAGSETLMAMSAEQFWNNTVIEFYYITQSTLSASNSR